MMAGGVLAALRHGFGAAVAGVVMIGALVIDTGVTRAEPAVIGKGSFAVKIRARMLPGFSIGQPAETRFGRLTFLGGLELESDTDHFGSLSGLVTLDQGRSLIAVSDNGMWFTGRLVTDAAGRPTGVSDARMAAMLGADGEPMIGKWESDAEGLTLRDGPGGRDLVVSFEGHHRLMAYPLDAAATNGRPSPVWTVPGGPGALRGNKSLEGVAVAPKASPLAGTIVTAAERGRPDAADHPGFLVAARPATFTIARRDDFDVTDLAFLPNGNLLVLERRFNWVDGVRMRLLEVPAGEIRAGARLVGTTLIDADMRFQIDNMEGLAVDSDDKGATILTIVSDDNRSVLQRTLLLRFRLD